MAFAPDQLNNPPNPPDYDVASETEGPPPEAGAEAADQAKVGSAKWPWTTDPNAPLVPRQAEPGAASTYNTSPAPQDLR